MKSNRRRSWISWGVLAALAIFAAALAWHTNSKPRNESVISTGTPQPVSLSPTPLSRNEAPTVSFAPSGYDKTVTDRKEASRRYFDAPVEFFGKVVDEGGAPIAGATTSYILANIPSFSGSPTLKGPTSDPDGLFTIKGSGPKLSVFVDHPNYYKTASATQQFEYGNVNDGAFASAPVLPTKGHPAVFVLRRKGASAALIHCSRIDFQLPLHGPSMAIDLYHGRSAQTGESVTLSLESNGDKLPLNEFYPFDWALTIEVPNGGVVTRGGTLDFEAPAGGYESSLKVLMPTSIGAANWKSRLDQEFFVLFSTGRYGRFRLSLSAEKGTGYLESYLNPTPGDRNLEFDPAKEIKVH